MNLIDLFLLNDAVSPSSSPFTNRTLNELKEKDDYKRELAIKNGFKIFEVFDTDCKETSRKIIIEYIKGLL